MNWRIIVVWATALVIIGWTGLLVVQKERVLATGRPILLRLAPVDPRSLIQGDYMQLRYDLPNGGTATWPQRGTLVATISSQGIVKSVRLAQNTDSLAANEYPLRYHLRGQDLLIGAESFFFQEGTAEAYDEARYGELRVAPDGESLLVGLRNEQLQPLGSAMP